MKIIRNIRIVFGSYALHTDPKSEAILDVCHFEDEMTRDRLPRVYKVVWVLVVFKLFRRPLLPACCSRRVLNCSRFPCVGKNFEELSVAISSICSR